MHTPNVPPAAPEQRLLLACAHLDTAGGAQERILDAAGGVSDWDGAVRSAVRHGLLPQLATALGAAGTDVLPEPWRRRIAEAHRVTVHRSLTLTRELLRVAGTLRAAGIPCIPYKGPALAQRLYGSVAARRYVDLDILVRPQDLRAVETVLGRLGYSLALPLPLDRLGAHLAGNCELPFISAAADSLVEIQWRFAPAHMSVPIRMDALWARARRVPFVGGTDVYAMNDADLLIVLCLHGGKHLWSRLGWVRDVAQLVATAPSLDWQEVFDRAARAGLRRVVLLGLLLCRDLCGLALPAEVLAHVEEDRTASRLARQASVRLFTESGSPALAEQIRFHLAMRERVRDRVRYLYRLAVTPSLGDLTSSDSAAHGLATRLRRPSRLVRKYAGLEQPGGDSLGEEPQHP